MACSIWPFSPTRSTDAADLPAGTAEYAAHRPRLDEHAGGLLLAYAGVLADTATRALAQADTGAAAVFVEPADPPGSAAHPDLETLLDRAGHAPEPDVRPDMLSALVYTSGTTGQAKGVMHTHANDVAIALNCAAEYRALHIAPLHHVGGMQAFLLPHLLVGAANVIPPRYDTAATLTTIQRERITTLFAVPTHIQQILHHPSFADHDLTSLNMITTGGAALPAATMQRVLARLCPRLYNGYGMTEASLTLLLHPRDALGKPGACGKPTLISQTRIVTHDPTRDVPPDEIVAPEEVGQLIVRGPQVTPGYWNNPIESAKRLRHGWLYTGDLFRRDAAGVLPRPHRRHDHIRGREHLPQRGRGRPAPLPGRPPGRRRRAARPPMGPHRHRLRRARRPHLTEHAVDAFCRHGQHLAPFKRPRRIVFLDVLPTNPTDKLVKQDLVAAHTGTKNR